MAPLISKPKYVLFLFQEQIKQTENDLIKCVHKPNAAAKKAIEKLLIRLKSAVKYFQDFIVHLYRNLNDICE